MLIGNVPVRLIANGIGRAVDFGLPTTIEYQFRNIPLELRALPRWMPFRFVPPRDRYGAGRPAKGVRWSKLPVNVHTGGPGSPTDPRTWADYDTAFRYYLDHRDDEDPLTVAHGIGLVIGEGLAFLDLDGCIVDGQINEFAKKLIAEFETYWEISASGKGVHGIARASLPPDHPRRLGPGLELYTRSRFCIFTGAVLDRPDANTAIANPQSMDCWSARARLPEDNTIPRIFTVGESEKTPLAGAPVRARLPATLGRSSAYGRGCGPIGRRRL